MSTSPSAAQARPSWRPRPWAGAASPSRSTRSTFRLPSRDGRTSVAPRRCALGRRGPPPMPTELKVLHGERRPCRLNRNAPKARNVPVMPEGMSAPAQAIWNRLTADYAHTGVLTSVDTDALQIYCEAVVRYRHGAKMLAQSGPLVRGARRGDLVKNPL